MNDNNAELLKDLLDEQWKEGGTLMLEQAQNFDGITLLNITSCFL